jgi:hypothetical protein
MSGTGSDTADQDCSRKSARVSKICFRTFTQKCKVAKNFASYMYFTPLKRTPRIGAKKKPLSKN